MCLGWCTFAARATCNSAGNRSCCRLQLVLHSRAAPKEVTRNNKEVAALGNKNGSRNEKRPAHVYLEVGTFAQAALSELQNLLNRVNFLLGK